MLVMLPLGASIAHLSMGQNLARESRWLSSRYFSGLGKPLQKSF